MSGPHATLEEACDRLKQRVVEEHRWNGSPCTGEAIALPAGAPWAAWVLRIGRSNDKRFRDIGAYFLAFEREHTWYVSPRSFEVESVGRSRRHPLSVMPIESKLGSSVSGKRRFLFRFRAEIEPAVCEVCRGGLEVRSPPEKHDFVAACDVDEQETTCTGVLEGDMAARAARGDGAGRQRRAPKGPAGPKDAAALKQVQRAMAEDFVAAELDTSIHRLERALDICGSTDCSAAVLGEIHVNRAIVLLIGYSRHASAQEAFERALELDPGAQIPEWLTTPELEKVFGAAKTAVAAGRKTR